MVAAAALVLPIPDITSACRSLDLHTLESPVHLKIDGGQINQLLDLLQALTL